METLTGLTGWIQRDSFNRTILEWKLGDFDTTYFGMETFNRTILEWKRVYVDDNIFTNFSFNRTSLGEKCL